jgi:DNA topoisomerase-1
VVLPKHPPLLTDLPCPKCENSLNMRRSKRGPWLSCSTFPKCRGRLGWTTLEPDQAKKLDAALTKHESANPLPQIRNADGKIVDDQYVPRTEDNGQSGTPPDALDTDAA